MTRKHATREKAAAPPAERTGIGAAEYFRAKLAYETTPFELKECVDRQEVLVLDVRDRRSFDQEHIPGSRNVPLDELSRHFASVPRGKPVVTYCWTITCSLATRAAMELAEKGFAVRELVGGIREWKKAGLPVDRK
ncbi:MAG: sulfurtransferase [Elusimicrobia bacterium]|nr:sulfurtransferase [Elusimicrobiota bacterium]